MRYGALMAISAIVAAGAAVGETEKLEPTHKDVRYGPHERNVLNVWIAEGETPTPVVVSIHGGGWRRGAAADTMSIHPYLIQGVSVVAISYRLCPPDTVPAPLLDAARAVQFVRHKAAEWGLDKTRLAVMGHSAGGCSALWLALHDDLADPDSDDPVQRESTKPLCALSNVGQTTIDIKVVQQAVGEKAASHGMIWGSVGAPNPQEALARYDRYAELYKECSPLTHLDKDDPPVLLYYKYGGDNIHSARFGDLMLDRAQELDAPVYMYAPERTVPPPDPFKGRWEFVYKQLLAK